MSLGGDTGGCGGCGVMADGFGHDETVCCVGNELVGAVTRPFSSILLLNFILLAQQSQLILV